MNNTFKNDKQQTQRSDAANQASYQVRHCMLTEASADPEEGTGGPDPPPPGKSQDIWVSIGNKQLDPPPPGKSWTPPENVGPPGTLKNNIFYLN